MTTKKILKVSLCSLALTTLFSCGKLLEPPTPPVTDSIGGLIAHWPLDSVTGAKDISGHHHDGMPFNTQFTTDRSGNKNSAFYFNGQNAYISVDDKADLRLNNTDFTLNAWVKLESYNSSFGSNILGKRNNDANGGYLFAIRGNKGSTATGILHFGPGGDDINAYGSEVVTLNEWHMVTCVYKLAQKKISFYVDGVLDKTVIGILSPNPQVAMKLYIGRDDIYSPTNGYFFQGALDDIRIYGKALTVEDILELYGPANTLNNGLIAYWPLDSLRGSRDISGHNHHGIINNVTYTTDSKGKFNGAFYFNGINSFITVNDSADLRLTNTSFAVNAWVKLESYNSSFGSSILTKRNNAPNGGYTFAVRGYASKTVPGVLHFGPGGDDINAYGSKVITTSSWHMLTAVYDLDTKTVSLYIDGVLDNTNTGILPPNAPATVQLYIGRDDPNSPTNGYFVKGGMEEIRIYGRTLSTREIKQLLNLNN
ncbi:MAG: LamG domain-containing protein [Chitinophaga sp.]|uniref:LamG domain-containing protein n=1 Tax=Chitinophaga sp. TaxID=1869181 RepID=UPI001B040FBD|nr:LamG domain-containing protein [Chitinophaga sp.]MBO9732581.1 LamG domain-containing protein [Chitinophaga sp.]